MRPLKMVLSWNCLATYSKFKGSLEPVSCIKVAREAASVEQYVILLLIRQYPK